MNPNDAIKILDHYVSLCALNRAQHNEVMMALNALNQAINPPAEEPAPKESNVKKIADKK